MEVTAENSSALMNLRSQLEVERKAKEDLMTKLVDTEAELEIKQHQLSRLPALQTQLKLLVDEREDLQRQLSRLESEQKHKEAQISSSSDHVNVSRVAVLESELSESKNLQAELQAKLLTVDLDVGRVQELLKEKASLEAKIRELEVDREEREKQVRESSDRYSNQILQLQIQVEELLRKKTSLKTRLSRLEVDLESKDEQMSVASSQFSGDVSNYQSILSERLAENEALKAKLSDMESKLSEAGAAKEIQLKLDAESREKRSLLSRIGDIEAELQRKEKQIRDIVDRYTRDIAELEYKLEDELKTKAALQRDVDKLKRGDSAFVDRDPIKDSTQLAELTKTNEELREELKKVSVDAEKSKKRLEEQLDALINNQDEFSGRQELEEKLELVEKSKNELEERLKKVNSERAEVIKALEEVINEVQSREDEIEGLATVLRKRDEELEHAKLIATKALASAQEMKSRMKGKSDDRQSELSQKVEELNTSIDFLTKKNESLERSTSRMERELQQRELECGELRNKLNRKNTDKPSVMRKLDEKIDNDGFQSISADFHTFDTASPTTRASSGLMMNESMSMESGEPQVASGWLHDFDSQSTDDSEDDSNVSFLGIHTTPSDSQSRRSIERDALRKYVRKRYMKSKVSA
jgi:chromosome segregation ATPase